MARRANAARQGQDTPHWAIALLVLVLGVGRLEPDRGSGVG
eukprot:CAMPEP_0119061068 /NCGR_PEP_ID=MMETSP1178-20130426/4929_1 /TAXON_ID=33656 /ORGANISM="unid sp, Strain CCMP2000" /LENGTH=40 /DNA_ID= /DNA_START= /DNA_END= /DNA_ORIENTATION=